MSIQIIGNIWKPTPKFKKKRIESAKILQLILIWRMQSIRLIQKSLSYCFLANHSNMMKITQFRLMSILYLTGVFQSMINTSQEGQRYRAVGLKEELLYLFSESMEKQKSSCKHWIKLKENSKYSLRSYHKIAIGSIFHVTKAKVNK